MYKNQQAKYPQFDRTSIFYIFTLAYCKVNLKQCSYDSQKHFLEPLYHQQATKFIIEFSQHMKNNRESFQAYIMWHSFFMINKYLKHIHQGKIVSNQQCQGLPKVIQRLDTLTRSLSKFHRIWSSSRPLLLFILVQHACSKTEGKTVFSWIHITTILQIYSRGV